MWSWRNIWNMNKPIYNMCFEHTYRDSVKKLKLLTNDTDLFNAIKGFYKSGYSEMSANDRAFKYLINKNHIDSLDRYTEDNLTELVSIASQITRGDYVLINFYKYLISIGLLKTKRLTLNLLKSKDFLTNLKKGYFPVVYSPYVSFPFNDRWTVDFTNEPDKNIFNPVLSFDFTDIENPYLRDELKYYIWYYPLNINQKKSCFYIVKSFLKILDTNNDIGSEKINVTVKDINDFKSLSFEKKDATKSVYLNTVKNFVKFVEDRKVINIKQGLYDYFVAYNTKPKGDTRSYNREQIKQIIQYLRNMNEKTLYVYSYILEIQSLTNMRPVTIMHIRKNDIVELSNNMYGVKTTNKRDRKITNITKKVMKLIDEISDYTLADRKRHHEKLSKNIFAYESGKNKQLILPKTVKYTHVINEAAKQLSLPEFGQTGIRNHYEQKVTEMVINKGMSTAVLGELSRHSLAVHSKSYDNYDKSYVNQELYNRYYNVEIGDIKITGKIEKTVKFKASQTVEKGLGACTAEKCDNLTNMNCLMCRHFMTTVNELPLYEEAVRQMDELIYAEDIAHEKEDLISKKAIYVAYIAKLEALRDEGEKDDYSII